MGTPKCSDADFMRLFDQHGASGTARTLKVSARSVYLRRSHLEGKYSKQIRGPDNRTRHADNHPQRAPLEIETGEIIIGSDGHYWMGAPSTAHRALVKFCKDRQPKAVIMGAGRNRPLIPAY